MIPCPFIVQIPGKEKKRISGSCSIHPFSVALLATYRRKYSIHMAPFPAPRFTAHLGIMPRGSTQAM